MINDKRLRELIEMRPCEILQDQTYYYQDNNSKVLAVAHADTVLESPHYFRGIVDNEDCIISAKLDDRLGIYAIETLNKQGFKMDVLLTDDEEIMQSTITEFEPPKKYNWIVQFDRRGTGIVQYQYDDNEEFNKALKKVFKIHTGSASDISKISNWKTQAFNIGIAYHDEHKPFSYCIVSDFIDQMNRFKKFYLANKDKHYSHNPRPRSYYYMPNEWRNQAYQSPEFRYMKDWREQESETNLSQYGKVSYPKGDQKELQCESCLMHTDVLFNFGDMRICRDCWDDYMDDMRNYF